MQIARKISVGSINGVKSGFKGIKEPTLVGRLVGQAMGVSAHESEKGTYQKFKGEFRAINADGEEIAAPVMYLPSPAQEMLADAINAADGKAVAFGFDIFAVPNPTAVLGYEYKIKPLLETAPSDPVKQLMAGLPPLEIKPKQAALPGVSETDKAEEKPTEEQKPEEKPQAEKATAKKK
jgi:hypothetical protein